jgi:hypothetical protein
MRFTKRYNHRTINFHLLPDLIEQVVNSAPDSKTEQGEKLSIGQHFLLVQGFGEERVDERQLLIGWCRARVRIQNRCRGD